MRLSQLNQPTFWQDLRLLSLFDLNNLEKGIKLHRDSEPELQAAAVRLFQNGVITAEDGGYLTPFGVNLLEHLDHLLTALVPAASPN
ncbi:TIGR02647 family protein [Pseudaeromonas sharmana]|uniref:TIGR02647 family protein n=1 Tax=Pseudaeromonas sharmana TaxID=328412 RepID=A0ABV8CRA3_9GAMM